MTQFCNHLWSCGAGIELSTYLYQRLLLYSRIETRGHIGTFIQEYLTFVSHQGRGVVDFWIQFVTSDMVMIDGYKLVTARAPVSTMSCNLKIAAVHKTPTTPEWLFWWTNKSDETVDYVLHYLILKYINYL